MSAAVHITGVKSLYKSLRASFCFLLVCEINKTVGILRRCKDRNGNKESKKCKKVKR